MRNAFLVALLFIPFILFSQDSTSKKVLMVLSSYGKDQGQTRPGYEFDEFSQAYLIFKNNGLSIDLASPKGGKVDTDKFNKDKAYNQAILADTAAMTALDHTLPTAGVDADSYDAIYIVGGKGAMFDLPVDPSLQDIILNLYKREGTVIASVCHGPAAFVNVKDGDDFIVKDVEITSFCNAEEELFGKKWVPEFPFLLEDKLKERGAQFSQTDFMLSNVAVSGKFVTGQNPFSTTRSAEALVKALGVEPAPRELYTDEATAYLIQDLLDAERTLDWANKELENNTEAYETPLLAVYGYYTILAAKQDPQQLRKGIELAELAAPYFYNEKLQMLVAKTYVSLDQPDKAREILTQLISKDLLKAEAEKMLAEL